MIIKVSKKHKFLYALFTIGMLLFIPGGIIAYAADDYSGLTIDVVEHIKVKTIWANMIRSVGFNILKFMAKIIDYLYDCVDSILSFNMRDLFANVTGFTDTSNLAWITLSIFVLFGAIVLLLFPDKIKINDYLRSVFISAALIISLPIFVTSMDNLRTKGVTDVSNISTGSSEYTIGDQLLSNNIISMQKSKSNNKISYYSTEGGRTPKSVYNININSVFNRSAWGQKVVDIGTPANYTYKYDTLNDVNKFKLLGLYDEYLWWTAFKQAFPKGHISYDNNTYCVIDHNDGGSSYHCSEGANSVGEYEQCLIYRISINPEVINQGDAQNVLARKTLVGALQEATAALEQLNRIPIDRNALVGDYETENLMTRLDFEDLSLGEQIGQFISVGYVDEQIYRYDFDFFFSFVFFLITVLSLLFSAFKCGSLLFDMLFIQIIAPVVIATDVNNSGRAKQVFKNLISSYLVFIVIALLLKVYILSILYIHQNISNYVLVLVLTVAFGKGVIDGPDLITKIMGIDAGLKSGIGTMMALGSAARTTSSVASTATHAAGSVAGGALGAAGGAAGSVFSATAKIPSNFKSGASAVSNTNFAKNNAGTGKALAGLAGVANVATGGILPKATQAGKDFKSNHPGNSKAGKVASNIGAVGAGIANASKTASAPLRSTLSGAKTGATVGNHLSHGRFSAAANALKGNNDYASEPAQSNTQYSDTADDPTQSNTQNSNTADDPTQSNTQNN